MTKKKEKSKEVRFPTGEDTRLIQGNEEAGYQLDEKMLALAFLDASQRVFNTVLTPEYSKTSKMLDIPESTLRNWWGQKDALDKLANTCMEEFPKIAALRLNTEAVKIITELARRGYRNVSTRDLTNLLSQVTSKARLLSGKSTGNIAVGHFFTPISGKMKKIP